MHPPVVDGCIKTRAHCRRCGLYELNREIYVCGKRCRIEAIEEVRVSFASELDSEHASAGGGRCVNHCDRTRVLLRLVCGDDARGRPARQWCFVHDDCIDTRTFAG